MQTNTPSVITINALQVYPLRLQVLRPGGTLGECIWPGDDLSTTIHFGAVSSDGQIAGVASFYEQSHPELKASKPVQLRGMATHPDVRGKGFGKAIVVHALQYYREQGADLMWCNAREVAVSFYENLGFQITGDPFNIGNIGKHWVMFIRLND
jgi:GNAT superfamily N-acetyltransferase